jgi:hypothetical protein
MMEVILVMVGIAAATVVVAWGLAFLMLRIFGYVDSWREFWDAHR